MTKDLIDPFDMMRRVKNDIERIWNEFEDERRSLLKGPRNFKQPSIDIEDKKTELVLTADLPGIDKKDIKINIENNKIEITAEKRKEKEEKTKNFFRQERSYSGFYRSMTLPSAIDPNKTKADFKDGVLKITMPKMKQVSTQKRTLHLK